MSRVLAHQYRRAVIAIVVWGAWSGLAFACPICFSGLTVTPGQQIDSAENVVIAAPSSADNLTVVEVIKGTARNGDLIAEDEITPPSIVSMTPDGVAGAGADRVATGTPVLLFHSEVTESWRSLGPIERRYADWLRALARSGSASEAGGVTRAWPLGALGWSDIAADAWPDRISIVAPFLESKQPLVAAIAYGELSRAPYSAMGAVAPFVDVRAVRSWIVDPDLGDRRSAYLLLLGILGGPDDVNFLERRIAEARATHSAQELAATLAALLEIEGKSAFSRVIEDYLVDRQRSLPEVQGALMALSVHGSADAAAVPRRDIVSAYRTFVRARPRMAGFVAADLTDWREWDAVDDFVDVLRLGVVEDPAERFAMTIYISESPDEAAKAALARLSGGTSAGAQ